jgi:DNA-binding SARP family transcriptional activator
MGKDVLKVSVLGPLRITVDERDITPGAPKLRRILAVLALRHNRLVTNSTLVTELWGGEPPISSIATLQTYIYHLRKLISEAGASGRSAISTEPLGYILRLEEKLDKDEFDALIEAGREALGVGNTEDAERLLNTALDMIDGAPLSNVDGGPVLVAHITELRECILRALELQVDAAFALSRYGELITRLRALIVEFPFHENFYARLMVVLQHSGRRAEALEAYRQLRNTLVTELGIEPSTGLREIQRTLLAGDPVAVSAAIPAQRGSLVRPAQLPPAAFDFVGRLDKLDDIEAWATGASGSSAKLLSITGMACVGKTALAIRAAHRIRSHFPDGQFYTDLHGSEDEPADPRAVLGGCLRAIGLSEKQIPDSLAERSQLFRSWTAERRVLVVLDDALTYRQVEAILPGGAGCCVLITSRSLLPGLPGATAVELRAPEVDDCISLLVEVAGRARIGADQEQVRTIVHLCGRLPLAIRAVGARLASAPQYPVENLVMRLTDERNRLQELKFGDLDVGARLRPSYERLGSEARRVLQSLVSAHLPVFTGPSVARLLGIDEVRVEPLLEELVHARFLEAVNPDHDRETAFGMPPLIRTFVQGVGRMADR